MLLGPLPPSFGGCYGGGGAPHQCHRAKPSGWLLRASFLHWRVGNNIMDIQRDIWHLDADTSQNDNVGVELLDHLRSSSSSSKAQCRRAIVFGSSCQHKPNSPAWLTHPHPHADGMHPPPPTHPPPNTHPSRFPSRCGEQHIPGNNLSKAPFARSCGGMGGGVGGDSRVIAMQ